MLIYTYSTFPCSSTMLVGDGACRRMEEGEHFIRLIGARYAKGNVRGVVYGVGMASNQPVSFVITKSQRSLDLWRIIEAATFGSVLRVSVSVESYVEFGRLVWLDSRTTPETPMTGSDMLRELPTECFRAMQHVAAIGNGPNATIPFIMESQPYFDCFRIVVIGLNPPAEIPVENFQKHESVLGAFKPWFTLVEECKCGHILDSAFPSPTALKKLTRNASPINPLPLSKTGFPGLMDFLGSLTLNTGEPVPVELAQAWLSPLPYRHGERKSVGFGESVLDRTVRRDFLTLLRLYQPDLVVFSGRITTRRAQRILKPLLSTTRSGIGSLRYAQKDFERLGFPSVSHRLWMYHPTVFIAAPDLRFFDTPVLLRSPVRIGFWDKLRFQISQVMRAELSCSPGRIHIDNHEESEQSVVPTPSEIPALISSERTIPAKVKSDVPIPVPGVLVHINSAPPGAEVSILGLPVKLTPADYTLQPGNFKGTLRYAGYLDQGISLTIDDKPELIFHHQLIPLRGSIEIIGKRSNQSFILSGSPLFPPKGKPFVVPDIEFGKHMLEVFEDGKSSPFFRFVCELSPAKPILAIQLAQAPGQSYSKAFIPCKVEGVSAESA